MGNAQQAPRSGDRIDSGSTESRRYWAKQFGVTEQELEDAVKKADSSVDDVRDFLEAKNQSDG